jgi:SOS-response transcriptional repressor LexA
MTQRQKELVEAISRYRATNRHCPTQAELADVLGVSRTRVDHLISALEKKGVVRRLPGKSRTLHVVQPD